MQYFPKYRGLSFRLLFPSLSCFLVLKEGIFILSGHILVRSRLPVFELGGNCLNLSSVNKASVMFYLISSFNTPFFPPSMVVEAQFLNPRRYVYQFIMFFSSFLRFMLNCFQFSIYYCYYVLLYMVCVSVPMHVPLHVHVCQTITGVGSLPSLYVGSWD